MPLEYLAPYFRGARFAVVALRRRHPDAPGLDADAARYIEMVVRYSEAAIATFRLRRAREERGEAR
jgi:hypothetical protein